MRRSKLQTIVGFVCGFLVALAVHIVTYTLSITIITFVATTTAILTFLPAISTKKRLNESQTISEFESFLTVFAEELKRGNSPELAYENTIRHYTGPLRTELLEIFNRINSGLPLVSVINYMTAHPSLEKLRPLIFMVCRLIGIDSKKAGEHLAQAILRHRENRRLLEEREHIAKGLSFKIKILIFACSASSAILLAMLPLFSAIVVSQPIIRSNLAFNVQWLLAIAISATSSISAYYAGLMSFAKNPYTYSVASLIIFWGIFTMATSFVPTLLVH